MAYKDNDEAKAYAHQHYLDHKEEYVARAKLSKPRQIQKNKEWVLQYLKDHPCVDCGESDLDVLEFDHIIPVGQKAVRVSRLIHSRKLLEEEIAKCEVRCANCHVRRTRRQFGWLRSVQV